MSKFPALSGVAGSGPNWVVLVSHDPPGQDGSLHTYPPPPKFQHQHQQGEASKGGGGNATNCRSLRVAVHARPAARRSSVLSLQGPGNGVEPCVSHKLNCNFTVLLFQLRPLIRRHARHHPAT